MTSFTATNHRCGRLRGFTLVEMLVVIGIIVVLIGILFPALTKAYNRSIRTRMALDIQVLQTALEAYRNDMRKYPSIDYADQTSASNGQGATVTGQILAFANPGAVVLCQALLGPGNATQDGYGAVGTPAPTGTNAVITPGFTLRPRGQVYGPYIEAGRFKIIFDANALTMSVSGVTPQPGWCFADRYGNPILYFAANVNATYKCTTAAVPSGVSPGFCTNWTQQLASGTSGLTGSAPLYNVHDNYSALSWTSDSNYSVVTSAAQPTGSTGTVGGAITRMQLMLGDLNADGWIQATPTYSEVPATTGPYLLWGAGPDGQYGIDFTSSGSSSGAQFFASLVPTCDDVTNFTP